LASRSSEKRIVLPNRIFSESRRPLKNSYNFERRALPGIHPDVRGLGLFGDRRSGGGLRRSGSRAGRSNPQEEVWRPHKPVWEFRPVPRRSAPSAGLLRHPGAPEILQTQTLPAEFSSKRFDLCCFWRPRCGGSKRCGSNATSRAKQALAGTALYDAGESPCKFARG
jgi:hypothetical protein